MHGDAFDDAGVVDQDIDLAHVLMDFTDQRLDFVFLGDVANIALDILDTRFLIGGEAAVHKFLLDVIEDDGLDAGSCESLCDVETDAV